MKTTAKGNYFVGLDIGTNSVGYAVTDEQYELLKYKQHPMWGVHLFDSAKQASERRAFRTARRRLDRRQQRIQLLRELFAIEIANVDKDFFQRIDNSYVKEKDGSRYAIFADKDYNDKDYYKDYPTIHHLICDLMNSDEVHDIRLVYIACAWLLAHRGHFLSDVSKERIEGIFNFDLVYKELEEALEIQDIIFPWKYTNFDINTVSSLLKDANKSKKDKHKILQEYLNIKNKKSESDLLDWNEFIKLLCGLEGKLDVLFGKEYEGKLSLLSDDSKIAEVLSLLEDEDAIVIQAIKKIVDWSDLANLVGDSQNISSAKVKVYEKHKTDLRTLKDLVKKYSPEKYQDILSSDSSIYATHIKTQDKDILKSLGKKLDFDVTEEDKPILDQIKQDIDNENFLPKQVNITNRTIPYQLYWSELKTLLEKASSYLPFLKSKDDSGLSVQDKILSIMEFRVPYFVGPLNSSSPFAWLKRKAEGRILPWNIKDKVDFEASEEEFIKRMLNTCTYLLDCQVLPKQSLLYQKFEVLNAINVITIDGQPIDVECKQKIYDLFLKYSKVDKKKIYTFLKTENYISDDIKIESIKGIDDKVNATLESLRFFHQFICNKQLTEAEIENIIYYRSITEDKNRFKNYLKRYVSLSDDDINKIANKKFSDFGRLSKELLTEIYTEDYVSGEDKSIINMMWDYNLNLQQLLSDKYTFINQIKENKKEYYINNPSSLDERLEQMYVSNGVKRPIIRTMAVLNDITKTIGKAPKKIFVEMARDVDGKNKKERKDSRFKQIQDLYKQINNEDSKALLKELDRYEERDLQKNTLYLYFMQLGRDMYTGEKITDLSLCNKEHIYPKSKVKDDSILNNIVLVNSTLNGEKDDNYPISADIRNNMASFWKHLLDNHLISDEKYARLIRSTPFSEDEQWGFINRQLVETRQSTKVITELIKEYYPQSEIVYVKAGLVSDYRQQFKLLKSRTINDLHHAKDAYLNIAVGNVYHSYFTKEWFDHRFENNESNYSIKTKQLFSQIRYDLSGNILWKGNIYTQKVEKTIQRNYIHLTSYSYCQHGGLFNQNPLTAGNGQVPLKKDMPIELYGGYNKPAASFFILALIEINNIKSKKELTLVSVDLMIAERVLKDEFFATEYVKKFLGCADNSVIVKFPLGLKPIKIKSVIELDGGLRFRINGKSNKQIGVSLFSPLLLESENDKYLKYLENIQEKFSQNLKYNYSIEYDKVSKEENLRFYRVLLSKLQNGIFQSRPANFNDTLINGIDKFERLSMCNQVKILLELVSSFGTNSNNGINLKDIEGSSSSGVTTLHSNLSNWKKKYKQACFIYSDAAGLHETKSINLLDLLK